MLSNYGAGKETLESPWTVCRSNQSILKEINPEYSLEGLLLKLKLQYFDHLMQRANLLKNTLRQGKLEGRRRRGSRGWDGWMASPTQWTWVWVNSGSLWWTGRPGVLRFLGLQRVGQDWATELNWTQPRASRETPIWIMFHLIFICANDPPWCKYSGIALIYKSDIFLNEWNNKYSWCYFIFSLLLQLINIYGRKYR